MKVGDYGFGVTIDTLTNLSTATAFTLRIVRPDGTHQDRSLDATAIIPATAPAPYPTVVRYTLQAGDLTVPGNYAFEIINVTAGTHLTSNSVEVYVGPGL